MISTTTDRKLWLSSKVAKAFSFDEYLYQIEQILSQPYPESVQKQNSYHTYIAMNYQRMNRWLKVLKPTSFTFSFSVQKSLVLLTLTESWCGDAAHILPILYFICKQNGLELKLLYRDEHPDLMDAYLTNGSRSIPKVIILDTELNELGSWGPRPADAQKLYNRLKSSTSDLNTIIHKLQLWYNRDKGVHTFLEVQEVLKSHSSTFNL
ncbi:thioredoxin family protein [Schleiferia thermophila]|uniref:thioredoxin family protein n=1 Tax=Schleiferia thermophila TaxID=884107 RepID=UPI003EEF991D